MEPNITVLEEAWGEADLGDAPHYMYKEIYEQPDALRQCIAGVWTERWAQVAWGWALTTPPWFKPPRPITRLWNSSLRC